MDRHAGDTNRLLGQTYLARREALLVTVAGAPQVARSRSTRIGLHDASFRNRIAR